MTNFEAISPFKQIVYVYSRNTQAATFLIVLFLVKNLFFSYQGLRVKMDDSMKINFSGHILPSIIALLVGLIAVAIFFVFGLFSARGEIGLIATCILFLMNCALIVGWHAASWWYVGTLVNIPIWCLLYFWTKTGLFDQYFGVLILLIIVSHIGSFIGLWFSGILKKMN